MRTLLATTCLTPMALCVAMPAAAQAIISGPQTTPIKTSIADNGTPADIIVTETGSIALPANGGAAVLVDSDNNVTNRGVISGVDTLYSTGGIAGGPDVRGNIINSGEIDFLDSHGITDLDGDGDADGQFTTISGGTGIDVYRFTGSVTNSATGRINIIGNGYSSGMWATELHGDLSNDGIIQMIGDNAAGVRIVGVDGSVRLGGAIFAQGLDASGVIVAGDVTGSVVLSGEIAVTGYRYVNPNTPGVHVSQLDSDDLLPGGPAVSIEASVNGGVRTSGSITSYGEAPALKVRSATNALSLGTGNPGQFGLVLGGNITADAVYQGKNALAVAIGELKDMLPVSIETGVRIDGSITATAVDGAAYAVRLRNANIALIENAGTISARTADSKQEAVGLQLDIGASVDTIRNLGTIEAVVAGGDQGAIAIAYGADDGALRLIENSGVIRATGADHGYNFAFITLVGSGITIDQVAAPGSGAMPAIVGDIGFGGDNNKVILQAGSLDGRVLFSGRGNNALAMSGDATMTGDTLFNAGDNLVMLANASKIVGNVDFGDGGSHLLIGDTAALVGDVRSVQHLTLSGSATLTGNVSGTATGDIVALLGSSTLTGNLDFGSGVNNGLAVSDAAKLRGNVTFGAFDDQLMADHHAAIIGDIAMGDGQNLVRLDEQVSVLGDISFGSGSDNLLMSGATTLAGNAALGEGDNTLALRDNAILSGNVSFGRGDNAVFLQNATAFAGDMIFGDGANTLSIIDDSKLNGNVGFGSGADKLQVAGSMTGNVAFGDGANQLLAGSDGILAGDLTFGQGDDTATLRATASITGNIAFGDGANRLQLIEDAKLKGAMSFGAGTDNVLLGDRAAITGSIDLGAGDDVVFLSGVSVLTGNVTFGDGADRLALTGGAQLNGNLSFGAGDDIMTLAGGTTYGGTADFAGGGGDTMTLADTARFVGTLANAQNLAVSVNGGTFAPGSTGTTAIGSLSVGAGGALGVTIDTAANTATRYQVSGNASFAPGSRLQIAVNGNVIGEATYTILHAGSVSGAENLTAEQLMLPFLLKSSIVTGSPANEIAIRVARKTTGDLGLNRSGASAYDAIFAALPSDAQVQSVVLGLPDAASFKAVVASMLPDHAGGAFEAVTSGSRAMGRMLENADAPFADQGEWGYWINGVGFSRTKDLGDTASYDVNGWGTAGGAEVKTDAGNFGLSIGYLHGTDRVNGTRNSVTAKQYEAALYWRGAWGGLHPFARLSAARIDFDGTRHFNGIAGAQIVARTADTDWKGNLLSAVAGASYEARFGQLSLRPVLSVDYYRLSEAPHTDMGGGSAFDLSIDRRKSDELAGNATLALGLSFGSRDDGWLRAELEGGHRQVLGGSLGTTTARFAGGLAFTLVPEDRTSGWLGRFRVSGGTHTLRLSAEFGREQQQGRAANAFRASAQLGF
jgi:hypothetical protein